MPGCKFAMKNGGYSKEVTKAAFNYYPVKNTDGSWGMIKGENTGSIEMTGLIKVLPYRVSKPDQHNSLLNWKRLRNGSFRIDMPIKAGGIEASYMALLA
jgi:hypothetical protein